MTDAKRGERNRIRWAADPECPPENVYLKRDDRGRLIGVYWAGLDAKTRARVESMGPMLLAEMQKAGT